mgnify:CR=1 FL=1
MMQREEFIEILFGKKFYKMMRFRLENEIIVFHDDGQLAAHYFADETGESYYYLWDTENDGYFFKDKGLYGQKIPLTLENRSEVKSRYPDGQWFEIDQEALEKI